MVPRFPLTRFPPSAFFDALAFSTPAFSVAPLPSLARLRGVIIPSNDLTFSVYLETVTYRDVEHLRSCPSTLRDYDDDDEPPVMATNLRRRH